MTPVNIASLIQLAHCFSTLCWTALQKECQVFYRAGGLPVGSLVLAQGKAKTEIFPQIFYSKVKLLTSSSDWKRISALAFQYRFDLGNFHISNMPCCVPILKFSWIVCRYVFADILTNYPPERVTSLWSATTKTSECRPKEDLSRN